MINLPVLVLNQSYEPLNICRVRRAVVLIYQNKAEMLENGSGFIHSVDGEFPVPSVIRLASLIRRPYRSDRKMSRLEIFRRDRYTCQYCGKQTRQLTLDHVTPRYRGGQHTWENVVSACVFCNRQKAGRFPKEAGMKLIHQPAKPAVTAPFYLPLNYSALQKEWQKYLPRGSFYYAAEAE
ncbi:MAG: HNH endonuclease [Dehalococcoidales bacterium]|nr:HNH endonuclease [Dehalococcoidales bacterium]